MKKSNKKTNAEKNQEILEALQNVYKKIDKAVIKKALPTFIEAETILYNTGFEFGNDEFSYEFVKSNHCGKDADNSEERVQGLKSAIAQIDSDNLKVLAAEVTSIENVVRLISVWNNTNKDSNNRSIIKAINTKILTLEEDKDKKIFS